MMRTLSMLAMTVVASAADEPMVPQSLPKAQQTLLLKFLNEHSTPERYVPAAAKFVDTPPSPAEVAIAASKEKPIRQYTVQITPHRPVPGSESVNKADVYFYRPNPEKGKQGLTVKHTVDLATGKQIGETEVLTAAHTPISREELSESVTLAKADLPALKALYAGREVKWEYLQMKINRKSPTADPGDRVLRIVFTSADAESDAAPVRAIVNLTKGTVLLDDR